MLKPGWLFPCCGSSCSLGLIKCCEVSAWERREKCVLSLRKEHSISSQQPEALGSDSRPLSVFAEGLEGQGGCARLEEACLSKAGEGFTGALLPVPVPGENLPSASSTRGGGGGSPTSSSGEQGRMPVLERYFPSAELGRRWTAPEGVLPSSLGSRPGCQQGPLPWDLPEMIRMVKLVWKSKSELQATRQRGVLENEDALHSFPGKLTSRCGRCSRARPDYFQPLSWRGQTKKMGKGRKTGCAAPGPRSVSNECLLCYRNAS